VRAVEENRLKLSDKDRAFLLGKLDVQLVMFIHDKEDSGRIKWKSIQEIGRSFYDSVEKCFDDKGTFLTIPCDWAPLPEKLTMKKKDKKNKDDDGPTSKPLNITDEGKLDKGVDLEEHGFKVGGLAWTKTNPDLKYTTKDLTRNASLEHPLSGDIKELEF